LTAFVSIDHGSDGLGADMALTDPAFTKIDEFDI
jgi:hypothetical protein